MTGWFDRFKPMAQGPLAQDVLADLNDHPQVLWAAIEGTYHTFATRLRLRSGAIVLTYPAALVRAVRPDAWVRLHLPGTEPPQDLRLQVSSARHGGSGVLATDTEHIVLLCKLAGASVARSLRREERISTARYRDVTLHLDNVGGTYRLLDLSPHGAKVRVTDDASRARLPVGKRTARGTLHLGNRVQVPVQYAIPRHVEDGSIGVELKVPEEGRAHAMLDAFISAVRRKEAALAAG